VGCVLTCRSAGTSRRVVVKRVGEVESGQHGEVRRSTSLIRLGESADDVRMNPLGWLLIGVLATGWLVVGVRPGARRWNALPPSIRSPLEVLYVLLMALAPVAVLGAWVLRLGLRGMALLLATLAGLLAALAIRTKIRR
jgi:hypothetical protein